MPPVVCVDLDGCVYPFDVAARTLLHLDGNPVALGDIAEKWDHIIEEVGREAWGTVWGKHRQQVMDCAPPYPGSIKALHRIEQKAMLRIVTHRPRDIAYVTMAWLAKYHISPYQLIHCPGEPKSLYAQDAMAFVEDRADNAIEIAANAPMCSVWVPKRGWNAQLMESPEYEGLFDGETPPLLGFFDDWAKFADWVDDACSWHPRAT